MPGEHFLPQVEAALDAAARAAPDVGRETLAGACRALLLHRLLACAGVPEGATECRLPRDLPEPALAPLVAVVELAPVCPDEAVEDAGASGAIGPETLAAVYERLRAGRHQDGVYYTPRGEVRFMCREALRARLAWEMAWPDDAPALLQWLHGAAPPAMDASDALALYRGAARLRVCDPAAGCGALLVGMAVEMVRVLERLAPLLSPEGRREAIEDGLPDPGSAGALRGHVVSSCLFGVDVDAAAAEVARHRLLLFGLAGQTQAHGGGAGLLWGELQRHVRVGDGLAPIDAAGARPVQLALFGGGSAEGVGDYVGTPGPPSPPNSGGTVAPEFGGSGTTGSPRVRGARGAVPGQAPSDGRPDSCTVEPRPPGAHPVDWHRHFPDAFARPEPGFDIVLSNPPYVRQELLPPDYKEAAARACHALLPDQAQPDGKSDLYTYFYHLGLGLLREGGALCVISSNSWLDVGFGKPLRALLLRHGQILSILESATRRTFRDARVNPAILLARRCSPSADPEGRVRFIRLHRGLGQPYAPEELGRFLGADAFLSLPAGRVVPIAQGALAAAPDDNWGGRFLRAPDLVHEMLARCGDRLCTLDALAAVRFGIKTGANDFFYLEDITEAVGPDPGSGCGECAPVRNTKTQRHKGPKGEHLRDFVTSCFGGGGPARTVPGLPRTPAAGGVRLCRNGVGQVFPIEERFLRPALRSPRELAAPELRPEAISACLFVCDVDRGTLAGTAALRYIEWGERELGIHLRPSVLGRVDWYRVPIIPPPPVLHPLICFERACAAHNPAAILCDANLVGITPRDARHQLPLVACLISSLGVLMRELVGIANLGQGALKTNPAYLARMQVPDLAGAASGHPDALDRAFARVRQEPFPSLLDGEPSDAWQELDQAVMSLLGPAAPRPEQVRAAALDLVGARLAKAASLRRRLPDSA